MMAFPSSDRQMNTNAVFPTHPFYSFPLQFPLFLGPSIDPTSHLAAPLNSFQFLIYRLQSEESMTVPAAEEYAFDRSYLDSIR